MSEEDTKVALASLEEARKTGRYVTVMARPPAKLLKQNIRIAICVPMGDKDDPDLFVCPDCGYRHFGEVHCEKCGHNHSAMRKLRAAGMVPMEIALSAIQLVPPLLCGVGWYIRKSVLSAQAREELTRAAMADGCELLFYWDDDVLLPPKTLLDMVTMMDRHPEVAAISGVYVTRESCMQPLIFKEHGQGSFWDFSLEPGVLEDIFGAGAGCLMVRASALEEVERILGGTFWAEEHGTDAGVSPWGHDIRFCRRLHEIAKTHGQPEGASQPWRVTAAGWIQCGHFDVQEQKIYMMPPDSPCFKKGHVNSQTYWDYIWKGEGIESPRGIGPGQEWCFRMVPRFARVLDLGCGHGVLLDRLAKEKQTDGYGYDYSKEAIAKIQSRWLRGEVLNLETWSLEEDLAKGDPEEFRPLVITATELLDHLEDQGLANVVKQSALADLFLCSVGGPKHPLDNERTRGFTVDELGALLKSHFEKVLVLTAGDYLVAAAQGSGPRSADTWTKLQEFLLTHEEVDCGSTQGSSLVSDGHGNALRQLDRPELSLDDQPVSGSGDLREGRGSGGGQHPPAGTDHPPDDLAQHGDERPAQSGVLCQPDGSNHGAEHDEAPGLRGRGGSRLVHFCGSDQTAPGSEVGA